MEIAINDPQISRRVGNGTIGLGDEIRILKLCRQRLRLANELATVGEDDIVAVVEVLAHDALHIRHGDVLGISDLNSLRFLNRLDAVVTQRVVVGIGDRAGEDRREFKLFACGGGCGGGGRGGCGTPCHKRHH